jgi:CheY-like chemotaxis protein
MTKEREIREIVESTDSGHVPLSALMPRRVRNILLVSSLYDSFTFEQDGQLTEVLFSEYLELNLRYAPRIERVSTAEEALRKLEADSFDLIISLMRVGAMDVVEFSRRAKEISPGIPVVLLAYYTRELPMLESRKLPGIDRIFAWHGDVRLFLAIIKHIEDMWNVRHDVDMAGVQCILLIEDNVSFYSSFLPLLYTELVVQTQELMAEGLNRMEKLIRMRARPKVLLATSYDEGLALYRDYREYVLGVITDVDLPREGKIDRQAGLDFARMVREETWDRAVLIQSSNEEVRQIANQVGAQFINKNSPTLLHDVREFMREYLGFGDFVFKSPDGTEIARASDLISLAEAVRIIPADSLLYHVARNHFSLWLMARTEFDLARSLRPRQADEFDDTEDLREFLITRLDEHLQKRRSGVVADFSTETFDPGRMFVRIGAGSLGGKGRGLAFINTLLHRGEVEYRIPGVRIYVPATTVVTTEIFDAFMEMNGLTPVALGESTDEEITASFLSAKIPDQAIDLLRKFLDRVHYPLAIRSSSLLEDASYQPFAGVYGTFMIPNNHDDPEVRLEELLRALRMVYASTYYADPRSYFEATPNRLEEEKMAVVIQEVVGRRHGKYLYPDIAGVARSYDYYPMEGMDPDDGVAMAALGLGTMVVEGGKCVRFSPEKPRRLYQFSNVEDYLEYAQREFYALDMTQAGPDWKHNGTIETNLVKLGLDIAERDGTLNAAGSTYIAENDAVYDGISREGVRLVTLAGVLKHKAFPLAESLTFLLDLGRTAFSSQVEIEFAANMGHNGDPGEMGFLQIRPMVVGADTKEINLDDVDLGEAIVISKNALGQGHVAEIKDLVYVKRERFDRLRTVDIAGEIEAINRILKEENRGYVLIGPGRWGTADRMFGIPVSWSQISSVKAFVETDISGISMQPSQGTHFFHNITSFGIPYFTVNLERDPGGLDFDWLNAQAAIHEADHVRLIRFDEPLVIAVDGRNRRGVIMKPGHGLHRQ